MFRGPAHAFMHYETYETPSLVHFGKRGAVAHAIGEGAVVVRGVNGNEVLRGVLHVPQLAVSLFSVRAAVNEGVTVSFVPQEQGVRVAIQRGGCTVFTASEHGGLFYLDQAAFCATAGACGHAGPMEWHRRLGHIGFSTLADLARSGLIQGCPSPSEFLQARDTEGCEACALGKMRRTTHPPRPPRELRVLGRVHADLCQLRPGCYLSSYIDEATRYAVLSVQAYKSETAATMRKCVLWSEAQTGLRVQRVRHDRGGEYMTRELLRFFDDRGIQVEPTAGYSPESNGIAERHNLSILDMVLPMLLDSADPAYGLPRLSDKYAPDAAVYANDQHNARPSHSAIVGATPHEGFFGRPADLTCFRRFGCRVWVHRPGHRGKLESRGVPGRFMGFERPFGAGIIRVLLDDGRMTQSQTVQFSDGRVPRPCDDGEVVMCDGQRAAGGGDSDDSDDEDVAPALLPGGQEQGPAPAPEQAPDEAAAADAAAAEEAAAAAEAAAEDVAAPPEAAEALEAAAAPAPAAPVEHEGRQVRSTRNANPRYNDQLRGPRAHVAVTERHGQRRVTFTAPLETPWGVLTSREEVGERSRGLGMGKRTRAARKGQQLVKKWGAEREPEESNATEEVSFSCAAAAVATAVVPRSTTEALRGPDAAKWGAAIEAELQAMRDYQVWDEGGCELPVGKQALRSHFILDVKRDGVRKARMVAGGDMQQPGLDFGETYALALDKSSSHRVSDTEHFATKLRQA